MMNARILLSMARDMLPLAAALGVVALYGRKKPEFAYRPDAGPCFLADGFLVLNERTPKAFPIGDIDRIEYPAEALEGAGEDFPFVSCFGTGNGAASPSTAADGIQSGPKSG